MIIGVLGDNESVEYSPGDKIVTVHDITIFGVETVADAIAKCEQVFIGFIANHSDDEVLIRPYGYDDEWYQPPLECVSCGCTFMMEDGDPSFCPGCGKRVSYVIKRKEKND